VLHWSHAVAVAVAVTVTAKSPKTTLKTILL
jgi:hypothetical protein